MAKPWDVRHLDAGTPLHSAVRMILHTRVKEAFSYGRRAMKRNNADGVHDMRVAVRRVTSALSVFSGCFGKKNRSKLRAPLKDLLALLGRVRDRDIFIESLSTFKSGQEPQSPGIDELGRFIAHEARKREKFRRRAKKMLRELEERHFMRHFRRSVGRSLRPKGCAELSQSAAQEPVLAIEARKIVHALLEKFLSHHPGVRSHPDSAELLHAMRIEGKRVRYGMENFAAAFGDEYAGCLEEVKALLDLMGTIHDCDVNIPRVARRIERARRAGRDAGALSGFSEELALLRTRLFAEMAGSLARWEETDMTGRIARSMTEATQEGGM